MPNPRPEVKFSGLKTLKNAPTSLLVVAIAALCLAIYGNGLFNGFVYDDYQQVVENYGLRDLGNLPRVFVEDVWSFMGGGQSNYYRPLMHATYMINYALFGLRPFGFHLVNILLHSGVSILVFFTSRRLLTITRPHPENLLPFITALLFAAHPIHTEAVTWVACLPELSFSLFYLWSFYAYMGAVRGERIFSLGQYSISLGLFVVATLYKETALTLPLMLLVYDYCRADKSYRLLRYVKRYVPFLGAAAAYLVVRTMVLRGFAPVQRHSGLNVYEYFINIFPLFVQYLKKLLVPINLSVYYVFHPISTLLTYPGVLGIAVAIFFGIAVMVSSRKDKLIFFNLMFIVIPLLPVLYIPGLGENTFTERYLYLPSLGFVFLAALAAGRMIELRPQAAGGLLSVVLIVACFYSFATVKRNTVWKNELILWRDAVAKSPDGVLPHNQLANAYAERGEVASALTHYRKALDINPEFADAYTNIGLLYINMGKVEQALKYYEKALRLKPDSPETYNNIGVAYDRLGMLDKAVASFLKSLRFNPRQPGVYNNLGSAYEKMGLFDKAIQEYRNALQVQANNGEAYNRLGIAYAKKRMIDEAIRNFQKALRINPDDSGFHNNIANAYSMKGLADLAAEHRRQAMSLRKDPGK